LEEYLTLKVTSGGGMGGDGQRGGGIGGEERAGGEKKVGGEEGGERFCQNGFPGWETPD
jgi:hypothetical protein